MALSRRPNIRPADRDGAFGDDAACLFRAANHDVVVEPVPTSVGSDNPPHYEPMLSLFEVGSRFGASRAWIVPSLLMPLKSPGTVEGPRVCMTLRWRELDSNHRYPEDKLPIRDGLLSPR